MIGDGSRMKVVSFGRLSIVFYCAEDVPVTLADIAIVSGIPYTIRSVNVVQEQHTIILNKAGASMLGGTIQLTKGTTGNYVPATRVVGPQVPPATGLTASSPTLVRHADRQAAQHQHQRSPLLPRTRQRGHGASDREADGGGCN